MKHGDLFRKAGALTLSAGIAVVVGDMGACLLVKFVSDLAGKYLENLEIDKLKAVLSITHPSDLNHDLRRVLQEAIDNALTNTYLLYADKLNYPHQKQEAKKLIDRLRDSVEAALLSPANQTDQGVVELIDTKAVESADELSQLLDEALAGLPAIDRSNAFPEFIRSQFVPQLQLCFGEELKKPQQHKAWVAYQRFLLKQLRDNAKETLNLSHETNRKLDILTSKQLVQFPHISKERLVALQDLLNTLDSTEIRLENRFQLALDAWVTDLRSQMAEFVTISRETSQKIDRLDEHIIQSRHTVQEFNRTLHRNWVSKYWLASTIIIGVMITGILINYSNVRNQPMDLTIFARSAQNLTLATDYPTFTGGELVLRLGNKDEVSQVPAHGETIVKQIPAEFRDKRLAIRLRARNWRAEPDSVTLTSTVLNLPLVPDGSLGTLQGNIRDTFTNPVAAVVDINNDTAIYANERGVFRINLPYRMQHERYTLVVRHKGYQPYKRIYHPKSGNIDVQLLKK